MKAVNDFDSIRDKVMDTHSSVINNVNNVKGNLKKHNIDLGFLKNI